MLGTIDRKASLKTMGTNAAVTMLLRIAFIMAMFPRVVCGGKVHLSPENTPTSPPSPLPFLVTVYYHVEPNPQFFESVEPGYFEAVSTCLREMSSSLAAIDVHATFCFAWLYCDIVYHRNHDSQTGEVVNFPVDTGIETFQQIIADGHELAYHTHPPLAVTSGPIAYYTRPNASCTTFDMQTLHRWRGAGADQHMDFSPGVYEFDDPTDPWYGQFTWERTTENLFRIARHFGIVVRHTNGGQRPLLDLRNDYGSGINHPHCLRQIRSLTALGFDLIAPECLVFFSPEYTSQGAVWSDISTGYVSYLGSDANTQLYYPDINRGRIDEASPVPQGLTFMPVQRAPQAAWMSNTGVQDTRYYNAELLGGKGGGGVRWTSGTFYSAYGGVTTNLWSRQEEPAAFPSLADQFNNAMQRHLTEAPEAVNAWGFNHHIVNVMWADLSGLSDNWGWEILFLRDIADGVADGIANLPRRDLVQFITMQMLSTVYYDEMRPHAMAHQWPLYR
ncbi:hypothetical protein AMJ85_02050 [candidate division BRC1 bacterium SM23_51]|nr:MAG: hypothetical protein AMJ85_02050 [candidate division BRC1 bacterium SM23_51]